MLVETFSLSDSVHIQVIRMSKSVYCWMGNKSASMTNLSVALPTHYDALPSGSNLLSSSMDDTSLVLAKRLCKFKC